MDRSTWWQGVKSMVPLAVSIAGCGVAWGTLARQGGMTLPEIFLMSSVVFAGASQFVAVGMLGAGAGMGEIILTTLILNLRHLLMGAALAPYFRRLAPWRTALLAHGLVDETFALAAERFRTTGGDAAFFLGTGTLAFVSWNAATLLGAFVGSGTLNPRDYALDFAFLGAFIGLLVPQIRSRSTFLAFLAAAVTALGGRFVASERTVVLLSAVAAAVAGVWGERHAN